MEGWESHPRTQQRSGDPMEGVRRVGWVSEYDQGLQLATRVRFKVLGGWGSRRPKDGGGTRGKDGGPTEATGRDQAVGWGDGEV